MSEAVHFPSSCVNNVHPVSDLLWKISSFFQLFLIASSTFLPVYWEKLGVPKYSISDFDSVSFGVAVLAPLIGYLFCRKGFYESIISLSYLVSCVGGVFLLFADTLFLKVFAYGLIGIGIGGGSTFVPLSVIMILPSEGFAQAYGKYRRYGSAGFLIGLITSGYLMDVAGPHSLPFSIAVSSLLAGILFSFVDIPKGKKLRVLAKRGDYHKEQHLGAALFSRFDSSVTAFFFFQMAIWAGFCLCFRYLPLRMLEYNASSTLISAVMASLGIIALLSLPWVGSLVDKVGTQVLLVVLVLSTCFRIYMTAYPFSQPEYFFVIQLLHIPTWILNDVFVMKYMKVREDVLGVVHIGVLIQLAITFGMLIGSVTMSYLLRNYSLVDSLLIGAIMPLTSLVLVKFIVKDYK